jgi:hypothetical protein
MGKTGSRVVGVLLTALLAFHLGSLWTLPGAGAQGQLPTASAYRLVTSIFPAAGGVGLMSESYRSSVTVGEAALPLSTTVLSSANFRLRPGFLAASHAGPGRWSIYLPLAMRNSVTYYEGLWETEPNNTYLQANGPIRAGRDYYGYPNDDRDYWIFYAASPGNIQVDLTSHIGHGVQLQLFYQSPAGGPVAIATSAPYHLGYSGQAGWYYAYIYAAGAYNQTTPYTLRVSYP